MNHVYDTFIKKTEILSEALEKATERTRIMLYVITFFSLLLIVSAFNEYLSWDRKLNANERLLLAEEIQLVPSSSLKPFNHKLAAQLKNCGTNKEITNEEIDGNTPLTIKKLQKEAKSDTCIRARLEEYVDSLRTNGLIIAQSEYFKIFFERHRFTIPIIGLSCYADDVYLIGGAGLLILLTYCFFSVRRENRIVQRIAKSIEYIEKRDPREYLHTHNYNQKEIALIKHNLMEYIFYGCVEFFIFNTGLSKTDITLNSKPGSLNKRDKTNKSGRLVLSAIYYLPIIAMVFCLLFEIISLVIRYDYLNSGDFVELSIRYALTAVFLGIIIVQSFWIKGLNNENSKCIDRMYASVLKSRSDLHLD